MITILQGDVIEQLRTLPDCSIQCVCTSPPYFGLRDYGIDGQIGMEETPELFVAKIVKVFREVRRVLRDDGTLWLNFGDSYSGSRSTKDAAINVNSLSYNAGCTKAGVSKPIGIIPGLKEKDLIGIPWMVAFALRAPYYTGKIRDEKDRIWLAAMVEAEGCMFIHKRKAGTNGYSKYTKKDGTVSEYDRTQNNYGAGLEVASTDKVIVDRCMQIAGIGSICEQTPDQNNRRKQTIYRWNVRSNECRWIIEELYPHFIAKQQEARLLLGCPSFGKDAEKAHESLKAIHQGKEATIDFPAPKPLYEPGWYLRSDVIWSKCNPMPESVSDRPTKAHEYVFLLTKKAKYYYDADAIRGKGVEDPRTKEGLAGESAVDRKLRGHDNYCGTNGTRNCRTVWEIATQPTNDSSGTARLTRVKCLDEVSCGMMHIVSPNCPVHGGLFDLVASEFCGGRGDSWKNHIEHTDDCPVLTPNDDSALPLQNHKSEACLHNSDYPLTDNSSIAIPRNKQKSKTDRVPVTISSCKPYVEMIPRIHDRSKLLSLFVQQLNIYGNNILPDEIDARLQGQIPYRIVDSVSLPITNTCMCAFFNKTNQQTAHFATFPEALVEPCIKAGTSERGCCAVCGSPYERVVEKTKYKPEQGNRFVDESRGDKTRKLNGADYNNSVKVLSERWQPPCSCNADTKPCIVLDPFGGSGTTAKVARDLKRDCILIELNPEYVKIMRNKLRLNEQLAV